MTVARFAVIITDGYDDPEPVADAAAELRAEDVTVIVVAPAGRSNRANLEAIATSPALVLEVPNFDDVADLLQSTIAGIGMPTHPHLRLRCLGKDAMRSWRVCASSPFWPRHACEPQTRVHMQVDSA